MKQYKILLKNELPLHKSETINDKSDEHFINEVKHSSENLECSSKLPSLRQTIRFVGTPHSRILEMSKENAAGC